MSVNRRLVFECLIDVGSVNFPLAVDLGPAKAGRLSPPSLHPDAPSTLNLEPPSPPPLPAPNHRHPATRSFNVHQERHKLDAFKWLISCYRRKLACRSVEG